MCSSDLTQRRMRGRHSPCRWRRKACAMPCVRAVPVSVKRCTRIWGRAFAASGNAAAALRRRRAPHKLAEHVVDVEFGHRTLADFAFPKDIYPLGRLDADSEGLLLLSDEPGLNARLLDPEAGHSRIYWAQVERIPKIGRAHV